MANREQRVGGFHELVEEEEQNELVEEEEQNELVEEEEQNESAEEEYEYVALPETIEEIRNLCENGPVYAEEASRYGEITVNNGQIWIHCFQRGRPHASILNYRDLLSRFNGSTEHPKSAFLKFTSMNGNCDDVETVIRTDDDSLRGTNFILLCSGLRGSSFMNEPMKSKPSFFRMAPGPDPVVDGIRTDEKASACVVGGVYGRVVHILYSDHELKESGFDIQLSADREKFGYPKFGVVEAGLEELEAAARVRGEWSLEWTVTDCGLVVHP